MHIMTQTDAMIFVISFLNTTLNKANDIYYIIILPGTGTVLI